MKRLLCLFLLLSLFLSGCAGQAPQESKKFEASFLDLFDTITTVVGFAASQEEFRAMVQPLHDELLEYHQLFDIYNDYPGISNLKTVNDNAGIAPVAVDARIIRLLQDCKTYHTGTAGRVNVAMGSVLRLWHDARSQGLNDPVNAALPDYSALEQAALHTDPETVLIDEAAGTVFITDPDVRLDVGAIAKGWALEQAAKNAPEGLLISVGGNVVATGPKDSSGTPWVIGIQDPAGGSNYLHTIYVSGGSVVTSGDYQRAYMVAGQVYHHIIDPDTLYPSTLWSSVTIVCPDSGLADALSTALFLLPQAEGQALLDHFGALAMWVDRDGNIFYSPGFEKIIRT